MNATLTTLNPQINYAHTPKHEPQQVQVVTISVADFERIIAEKIGEVAEAAAQRVLELRLEKQAAELVTLSIIQRRMARPTKYRGVVKTRDLSEVSARQRLKELDVKPASYTHAGQPLYNWLEITEKIEAIRTARPDPNYPILAPPPPPMKRKTVHAQTN